MSRNKSSKFSKTAKSAGLAIVIILVLLAMQYADNKWLNKLNPFYTEPETPQITQQEKDLLNKTFNENTTLKDSPKIGGSSN